ncbi:hypothetical protein SAMN04490208_4280 [Pseudomonas poae]|uniref:DUF427 domain-containing protein n=1 Tax=Pseudomonas poae TaxID=200451 RepID=A0ABY0RXF1_9PSED|nr:hypothetical protein SAMN04490208_4280 [Pseudomonas poae]
MQGLNEPDVDPTCPPPRLFKYLHPDRVDVLKTGKICFSSPTNLNDPFELKPPLRLYESEESMWATVENWTCPYKTGHQLPVKLMLLPSA